MPATLQIHHQQHTHAENPRPHQIKHSESLKITQIKHKLSCQNAAQAKLAKTPRCPQRPNHGLLTDRPNAHHKQRQRQQPTVRQMRKMQESSIFEKGESSGERDFYEEL